MSATATTGKAAANGAAANPKGAAARRVIDLDKQRAARAELAADPPVIVLGGEEFSLPPEMPLTFLDEAQRGNFVVALRELLGEEPAAKLLAMGFSLKDFTALFEEIDGVYGMAEGD